MFKTITSNLNRPCDVAKYFRYPREKQSIKGKRKKAIDREKETILQGIFIILNNQSLAFVKTSHNQIKHLVIFESDLRKQQRRELRSLR